MPPKRVALVTGGNRGIGYAAVRRLAQLGYCVLLAARDAQRGEAATATLQAEGLDVHLLHVVITDEASVAAAAREVEATYKRLDALINNAAVMDYDNHVTPLNLQRMREEFEVNFFAAVAVTNAFLPLMLRTSDAPRVVNVSSVLASHGTVEHPHSKYCSPLFTSYKCTKAALNTYTHNLAYWLQTQEEGSAKAAKVNAAYPGYVRTDMSRNSQEASMGPEEGAETLVYLATLPEDGPTGGFFHKQERLPW
ncbi:short chain dehydrogenase [Trypanosoma conorhini]|uniref:Short chain dehydrogenase n=1 Tax=Trypanosoma conorhini TaxID=83891 RepID=A0A3R7LJ95_9TRYP|nr:short chain dehydrogenase [Trypanosoma conorhini]RNF25706.1 short chain dehydrogenase [Trypanosoma conorhini]